MKKSNLSTFDVVPHLDSEEVIAEYLRPGRGDSAFLEVARADLRRAREAAGSKAKEPPKF